MSTETKNPQAALVKSVLNSMKPIELVEDTRVKDKFILIYNRTHGSDNGELFYERERFHFSRIIQDNPGLQKCTGLSLYGCILDTACDGLSFEGGSQPHVYITPKNLNVGTKENPVWETRAVRALSPYGELLMRMKAGHLRHADNPQVVYDCDGFEKGTNRQGNWVKHSPVNSNKRPKDAKIITCFIRLVRTDGSVDFSWLDEGDIERLKGYSLKQNKTSANALYSSNNGQIDVGFLKAKTIKHAFKSMPKLAAKDIAPNATTIEEPDHGMPAAEVVPDDNESFVDAEVVQAETVTVEEDQNDQEGGF